MLTKMMHLDVSVNTVHYAASWIQYLSHKQRKKGAKVARMQINELVFLGLQI